MHPSPSPTNSNVDALTVLLVEDDILIRSLVAMALAGAGFEVIQTTNGEEAVELVEANPERPLHLLITDMVMPRIGGNELASRLKTIHPQLRILFCSGHPKETVVQENRENETIPFLRKPFSTRVLLETVNTVLRAYAGE